MPRTARLDAAGLLQHVIVRGIEKRDIFLDDEDRTLFLKRFEKLLTETGTDCLAWALMSNHVHFLLRPSSKLSLFMRRLLTGHAVTFNIRHQRAGHLFQNRYKSIVCEEEPYLLELVRYIHLNPLRAGIVNDIDELDRYPWCGHAVLMGNRRLAGQMTTEVLELFGGNRKDRRAYREFINAGALEGHKPLFSGGGKRRSLSKANEHDIDAFDDRILGSGDFVRKTQQLINPAELKKSGGSLAGIAALVAEKFGVTVEDLRRRKRTQELSDARSALCYLAVRTLGFNGEEVAGFLNITRSGVSIAAGRGERIVAEKDLFLEES